MLKICIFSMVGEHKNTHITFYACWWNNKKILNVIEINTNDTYLENNWLNRTGTFPQIQICLHYWQALEEQCHIISREITERKKIMLFLKDKDLNTEKYARLCLSHTTVKTEMESLGKSATTAHILFNNLILGASRGKYAKKCTW